MMVDTRVYGLYVEDVGMVHNDSECAGDILRGDDGHTFAVADVNGDVTKALPLYSVDDTQLTGELCDSCGEYIFEPDYRGILEQAVEDILREESPVDAALKLRALFTTDHPASPFSSLNWAGRLARDMDYLNAIDRAVAGASSAVTRANSRAVVLVSELDEDDIAELAVKTTAWETGG